MTKQPNIIGVTGHRKLDHKAEIVKTIVKNKLQQYNADCVVTGMALGFDMLVAEVCVEENIPFVAAIPCEGQTNSWPEDQKERYNNLLKLSWKRKIVCPGPFQIWKLFERNRWIVNRSTHMFSYWNGEDKGGTAATVKEAKKIDRPHENLYFLAEPSK